MTLNEQLEARKHELRDLEEHVRDQIEFLSILEDHGHVTPFTDVIGQALERRRVSVLRQLRDVEQELDHAIRR